MKYIGDGSHLIGIPARDLTEAEVALYGGKEFLLSTRLYAEVQEAIPETKVVKKSKPVADEPAEEGAQ